MKNFCIAIVFIAFFNASSAHGDTGGMPQLDSEFWPAQILWLLLIFSGLYLIIWKIFLPKISNSIEDRKKKVLNDLNETQKLKESAEKKFNEYNQIIEKAKKDAKKIIEDNKKKLVKDIDLKSKKFNEEFEKELTIVEKEVRDLKNSSLSNMDKIAVEISAEIIKKIFNTEVNTSNVTAVVKDISKRKINQYL